MDGPVYLGLLRYKEFDYTKDYHCYLAGKRLDSQGQLIKATLKLRTLPGADEPGTLTINLNSQEILSGEYLLARPEPTEGIA